MKLAFLFDVKLNKYYLLYFNKIKLICRSINIIQDFSNNMYKVNQRYGKQNYLYKKITF